MAEVWNSLFEMMVGTKTIRVFEKFIGRFVTFLTVANSELELGLDRVALSQSVWTQWYPVL